jgi:hypothetical protein
LVSLCARQFDLAKDAKELSEISEESSSCRMAVFEEEPYEEFKGKLEYMLFLSSIVTVCFRFIGRGGHDPSERAQR